MLKSGALVTASVLALTGTAVAADLSAPRYTKAPVLPVGVPEWAGWYVGIQGGVAQNNASFEDLDDFFGNAEFISGPRHDIRKTGGVFGGNVGYNYQAGTFVYGLETDINWVRTKASQTLFGDPAIIQSSDISWMGSFRGRVGVDYLSTLFYATGDLAYGGVKNSVTSGPFNVFVDDKTKVG
jgi:outer membrane immunogenic protein